MDTETSPCTTGRVWGSMRGEKYVRKWSKYIRLRIRIIRI